MKASVQRSDGVGRTETDWWIQAEAPVRLAEIDLAAPLPDLWSDGPWGGEQVLVLVRLHTAPLGIVFLNRPRTTGDLATAIWRELSRRINQHLRDDGLGVRSCIPTEGLGRTPATRCQQEFASLIAAAPFASVVVATRDRTERLARCLESLLALEYPGYEIIVVDNDPSTDATAQLIESLHRESVRYVREDRRGLASAHNCGLAVATGEITAFTDDDVVVDRQWLAALALGFRRSENVGAVTGLILPAQLDTPAQLMLERHGGFAKGFDLRIFDLADHRPADALFPFTAGQLGSGANMAFDTRRLRDIGGFDPAIGVGTRARGGDDLAGLFSVIAAGHQVVYQPAALVWHRHRQDWASLENQAYGYGVGLGAYLTSVVTHHPGLILPALRRAPAGYAYAVSATSPKRAHRGREWPPELTRLERRGLLKGPFAYLSSRWHSRSKTAAMS
jgi:GT2 family glycosyltransferase